MEISQKDHKLGSHSVCVRGWGDGCVGKGAEAQAWECELESPDLTLKYRHGHSERSPTPQVSRAP